MRIIAFRPRKLTDILIIFLPFTAFAWIFNWGYLWIFLFSAVGMIPMAGYIGEATESLAVYTGPRLGGMLNATLGNAAELIITIVAIREGLLDLVKASITGSIIGNILFVLGMAMFFGGIRNGVQVFDRRQAGNNAILLLLAIIALIIPSIFSSSIGSIESLEVEALSLGVAAIMIILYVVGVIYSLRVHRGPLSARPSLSQTAPVIPISEKEIKPGQFHPTIWSLRKSLIIMGLSTIGVVFLSELLVSSIEPVISTLGVSEFFLGIIFVPIIGNVAEHLVAVKVAIRNQMDLSVEVAVSSSIQIALFVAPLLVFISLILGNPLQLIFHEFELLALGLGILIAAFVSIDGESNWLEGIALLAVYLILALAFFLLPV